MISKQQFNRLLTFIYKKQSTYVEVNLIMNIGLIKIYNQLITL